MLTFIGIDVSKTELEICATETDESVPSYCKVSNSKKGASELIDWLKQFKVSLVVIEATGGYERLVRKALESASISVAVVNPVRVRSFAKGVGQLAKTDRIDAQILSRFARVVRPKPSCRASESQELLSELNSHATFLRKQIQAAKNRAELSSKFVKKAIERTCKSLERELVKVNEEIARVVKADSNLERKVKALEEIKGVGWQTAVGLLGSLPELGTINRKQIAALCGLAPYTRESGKWKGKRFISGGRKEARRILYMPALTAARSNEKLAAFYQSLVSRGKPAKVALTAVMRRLVVIANAVIRDLMRKETA